MNILVVLAHPRKGSFNHAIAQTAVETLKQNGHEVVFHDLYDEGFDPVLPDGEIPKDAALCDSLQQCCQEVAKARGIVIVHPNWWGQPPAILKGWIDRVIRPGVAYEFKEGDSGEGVPCGLLKARAALVFNTSNTPEAREREVFGDPLDTIWKNCVFGLCGVTNVLRRTFSVIVTSTPHRREQWLEEVREMVNRHFPR
jgi:putative NADPH-quinone reductase